MGKEIDWTKRRMNGLAFVVLICIGAYACATSMKEHEDKKERAVTTATIANDPVSFVQAYTEDKIGGSVDGDVLRLTVNGDILTVGTMRSGVHILAKEIVPKVFAKFPAIEVVNITRIAKATDVRGNQSDERAMGLAFSRDNAKTIQWDNIRLANIPKIADEYWESPMMKKED